MNPPSSTWRLPWLVIVLLLLGSIVSLYIYAAVVRVGGVSPRGFEAPASVPGARPPAMSPR